MNLQGLSSKEAQLRFEKFGPNLVTTKKVSTWLSDLKSVLLDPMGLMLLVLAFLYYITQQYHEAVILSIAFIPVVGVDVFLNIKAKKALTALGSTFLPNAKVIRDSKIVSIESSEVVPGDLMVFEEGQIFCADGKILDAENLSVDESSISGESVPVLKSTGDFFLSGTTILSGRGHGEVEETGKNSRFGKIASLMEKTEESVSPLKQKMDRFIKVLFQISIGLVVFLFILEVIRGTSFGQSLIDAITFGMAAVPEEFAIVYTLYLSLGAWRLSKKGVLIRSLPSVEALGSIDILCTDKTGTLTQGLFRLENLIPLDGGTPQELILESILACEPIAVDTLEKSIFDKALKIFDKKQFDQEKSLWKLIHDYPFEAQGKHMSHVWEHISGKQILCMKGAFEGIAEHCNNTPEEIETARKKVNELSSQANRVLALATKNSNFIGERQNDEKNCRLRALLVFSDPIREEAREAVEKCQSAGIQVKMITGDHLLTAHAVAEEVGLLHDDNYLFSGDHLSSLSFEERKAAYIKGNIFARVRPEQKYELVEVLKSTGQLVAMTGDGINDAPALRRADVGISMGPRATDLTRSQAEIALIKDDFYGLVQALFEGRRIFENLKKSFSYLLSFHVPVILLTLIPSLLGWPTLLFPVHLVLLELMVHPISAFVFENMEIYKGEKISTKPNKNLLTKRDIYLALGTGFSVSLLCLIIFASLKNQNAELARSFSFFTLLLGSIGFISLEALPSGRIIDIKSFLSFRMLISTISILSITFAIFWNSSLQRIFHVSTLSPMESLKCAGLLILLLCWRPLLNWRQLASTQSR